jgi:hypothetical protein
MRFSEALLARLGRGQFSLSWPSVLNTKWVITAIQSEREQDEESSIGLQRSKY